MNITNQPIPVSSVRQELILSLELRVLFARTQNLMLMHRSIEISDVQYQTVLKLVSAEVNSVPRQRASVCRPVYEGEEGGGRPWRVTAWPLLEMSKVTTTGRQALQDCSIPPVACYDRPIHVVCIGTDWHAAVVSSPVSTANTDTVMIHK